jgi:WD repeat-containing protein 76
MPLERRLWDARKLELMPISARDDSDDSPAPAARTRGRGTPEVKPSGVQHIEEESIQNFIESDEGTLRGDWRHDKSVTSAYWDPAGRRIVSTCYDDKLRSKFMCFQWYVANV